MKLVRFADGTYGVRKGIFNYQFLDRDSAMWWTQNPRYYQYYSMPEDAARVLTQRANDRGKAV